MPLPTRRRPESGSMVVVQMHEVAGHIPEGARDVTSTAPAPAADGERILLLECRLEQLRSALDEARSEADSVRMKLAEGAVREADQARRHSLVHQELAEARAEIASLRERLDRSEALRAELEGHLFEAGARGDAAELVRLRREVMAQRQRSIVSERTSARLRARADELLMSRETLLTRVAEWQRLVQREGPAAADLAEFMAELRRDILHLEHRNAAGERQEAALRQRLVRAGLDPDASPEGVSRIAEAPPPVPAGPSESAQAEAPARTVIDSAPVVTANAGDGVESDGVEPVVPLVAVETAELELVDLFDDVVSPTDEDTDSFGVEVAAPDAADQRPAGRVAEPDREGWEFEPATAAADSAPVDGLRAEDPSVRATAYERLVRALENEPVRLALHLRPGLADPHPRVRRRAVLAAATAHRLPVRALLEPLQSDPDPHVRRVVREVLRHARSAERRTESEEPAVLAPARVAAERRP